MKYVAQRIKFVQESQNPSELKDSPYLCKMIATPIIASLMASGPYFYSKLQSPEMNPPSLDIRYNPQPKFSDASSLRHASYLQSETNTLRCSTLEKEFHLLVSKWKKEKLLVLSESQLLNRLHP